MWGLDVMSYQLDFTHRHFYPSKSGIKLPITLLSDSNIFVDFSANLDTGSTHCIFEKKYADWLELDVKSGTPLKVSTATGYFQSYGHEVTLSFFDMEWQAVVYFAENESFYVNVLGRLGFLDRLKIGLVDNEDLIYLALY